MSTDTTFDHVTIRVADSQASERFYDTVLTELELGRTADAFPEWDDLSLAVAGDGDPPTRRLHVAFAAPSREHADAFWRAGTRAGYRDDGAPGPRPQYGDDYYGAFLLDPDGNSVEAALHDRMSRAGTIDHLWLRVADVAAAARFYDAIAPYAGLQRRDTPPEIARFAGAGGSFTLVAGTPTENVHIAFPADDDVNVDAFHRVAVQAGHRDNGAPGERPAYHPGYYGAYVLDPDGNNIEVVNHHRPPPA